MSLTRLSYNMNYLLSLQLKFPMKLKLKDIPYIDIWTPELGEHLEVQCEPENAIDKYAVCLKTSNGTIVDI